MDDSLEDEAKVLEELSEYDPWVGGRIEDLSERSKSILRVIDNMRGTATTSEVADILDIDNTTKVVYQVQTYLEPDDASQRNLVTSLVPETGGNQATVLHLTPSGEQILEYIRNFEDSESLNAIARIERLEALTMGNRHRLDRLEEKMEEETSEIRRQTLSADDISGEYIAEMKRLLDGLTTYFEQETDVEIQAYISDTEDQGDEDGSTDEIKDNEKSRSPRSRRRRRRRTSRD